LIVMDNGANTKPAPVGAAGPWKKALIPPAALWDILTDAVDNFQANGDTNQAAAISLYAILSFLPLFVLTFVMATHFLTSHPGIQEELLGGIRRLNPYLSDGLLAQLGGIEEKKKLLGWAGVITLVWFSAMIFSALEVALNIIFRAEKSRNYLFSKLLAVAMIPTAWVVGLTSVAVTAAAAFVARQPLLAELPLFSYVQGGLFRFVIPYAVTVLFFTIVYRVVPTAPVPLGVALAGSAVFSALMEGAKHFFAWYITHYSRYHLIFGSLEAVIILVIWVFYVALILLFCAEMMSSYLRRDLILLERALFRKGGLRTALPERLKRRFGRFYPQGSYIFREGDEGREMFYILTGRVAVEKAAGEVTKVLAVLGAGDYFGEMAALVDAPRTASARALEDAHIAVIARDTFRDLLKTSEGVSLVMLREFSRRIKATNEALEEATQAWMFLMCLLYFYRFPPPNRDRDPVADISVLTARERHEIVQVLRDLDRRGVIAMEGEEVVRFDAEKAWSTLGFGKGRPGGLS